MGNLREELALAKHMPEQFKQACPVCKQPWHTDTVDFFGPRHSLSCRACDAADSTQHDNIMWRSHSTGHFVPSQMQTVWNKLWRRFVMAYGLRQAILMTAGQQELDRQVALAKSQQGATA